MAKIVTSQGIQDFVATGKPTEVVQSDQDKAAQAKKTALNGKLAATDAPEIEPQKALAPSPGSTEATPEAHKEPTDADLDDEEKKLAKDIQKKIFKQIAKRKEAQAEAKTAREEAQEAERFAEQLFNEREQYKKRLEEVEKQVPRAETPKEPELVKPNPEDKKYYDAEGKFKVWEYSADLSAHAAKEALAQDRKAQQEARAKVEADQRAQADAAAAEDFRKRMEKAKEKHPDWENVVGGSDITLPNECLQYITQSDKGTDVAYYLATHKEEAERIRGLHPIRAIAELGKIEAGLESKAAPPANAAPPVAEPQRSAPAPITPISTGTGTVQLDPAKMNFKELRAYERSRAKTRH